MATLHLAHEATPIHIYMFIAIAVKAFILYREFKINYCTVNSIFICICLDIFIFVLFSILHHNNNDHFPCHLCDGKSKH